MMQAPIGTFCILICVYDVTYVLDTRYNLIIQNFVTS